MAKSSAPAEDSAGGFYQPGPVSALQEQVPQQGSRKGHDSRENRKGRKGKGKHAKDSGSGGKNGGAGGYGGGVDSKVPKAQILLNCQICRAADTGGADAILQFAAQRHASMSIVNLTTTLHKLARCSKDGAGVDVSDPRFVLLRVQTRIELQRHSLPGAEAQPRCWATIAWAYATMQVRDDESIASVQLIGDYAVPHVASFKPIELTNLIWAFAKLQVRNSLLFQGAQTQILSCLNLFSQSNLSTIVWAFVTAQHLPCQLLLRSVSDTFVQGLFTADQVNPTEITNFIWGLATAQLRLNAQMIAVVGDFAATYLSQFKLHELSITAWAFSRLGSRHDGFFHTAARALQTDPRLRHQIHPQGIANLLWSFAKQVELGSEASNELRSTLPMLIPTCSRLLNQLKPLELSSVLWALTKLGVRGGCDPGTDELFYAATYVSEDFLRRLSLQSCINLLGAFSTFVAGREDVSPPACIEIQRKLAAMCFDQLAHLQPVSETAILEAIAEIKNPPPEIMSLGASAVAAAARDIRRFNKFGLERLLAVAENLDARHRGLLLPVVRNRLWELNHTSNDKAACSASPPDMREAGIPPMNMGEPGRVPTQSDSSGVGMDPRGGECAGKYGNRPPTANSFHPGQPKRTSDDGPPPPGYTQPMPAGDDGQPSPAYVIHSQDRGGHAQQHFGAPGAPTMRQIRNKRLAQPTLQAANCMPGQDFQHGYDAPNFGVGGKGKNFNAPGLDLQACGHMDAWPTVSENDVQQFAEERQYEMHQQYETKAKDAWRIQQQKHLHKQQQQPQQQQQHFNAYEQEWAAQNPPFMPQDAWGAQHKQHLLQQPPHHQFQQQHPQQHQHQQQHVSAYEQEWATPNQGFMPQDVWGAQQKQQQQQQQQQQHPHQFHQQHPQQQQHQQQPFNAYEPDWATQNQAFMSQEPPQTGPIDPLGHADRHKAAMGTKQYVVKNTFVDAPDDEDVAARLQVHRFRSVQPSRTCDVGGVSAAAAFDATMPAAASLGATMPAAAAFGATMPAAASAYGASMPAASAYGAPTMPAAPAFGATTGLFEDCQVPRSAASMVGQDFLHNHDFASFGASRLDGSSNVSRGDHQGSSQTGPINSLEGADRNKAALGTKQYVVKNTFVDSPDAEDVAARLQVNRFRSVQPSRTCDIGGMPSAAALGSTFGLFEDLMGDARPYLGSSSKQRDNTLAQPSSQASRHLDVLPTVNEHDVQQSAQDSRVELLPQYDAKSKDPPPSDSMSPAEVDRNKAALGTKPYVVKNTFVESPDTEDVAARLQVHRFRSVQPSRTCDIGGVPAAAALGKDMGLFEDLMGDARPYPGASSQQQIRDNTLAPPASQASRQLDFLPTLIENDLQQTAQEARVEVLPQYDAQSKVRMHEEPSHAGSVTSVDSVDRNKAALGTKQYVVKNTFVESPDAEDVAARLSVQCFRSYQPSRTCDIGGMPAATFGGTMGLFEDVFAGDGSDNDQDDDSSALAQDVRVDRL